MKNYGDVRDCKEKKIVTRNWKGEGERVGIEGGREEVR